MSIANHGILRVKSVGGAGFSSLDSSTLPSGIGSFSSYGIGLSLRQPSSSSLSCMLRALSTILLFGDRTNAMTALVYHSRSAFFSFQLRHKASIKRGMMGFAGPTSSQAMTFSRAHNHE